ncbi:hypothetical protein LINPERPRIM_LOCUS6060 [Linum perenne]
MRWATVDIEGDATQVQLSISKRPFGCHDGGALVSYILTLLDVSPGQTVLCQSNMTAYYVACHGLRCLPSQGVVNLSAWVDT